MREGFASAERMRRTAMTRTIAQLLEGMAQLGVMSLMRRWGRLARVFGVAAGLAFALCCAMERASYEESELAEPEGLMVGVGLSAACRDGVCGGRVSCEGRARLAEALVRGRGAASSHRAVGERGARAGEARDVRTMTLSRAPKTSPPA